MWSWIKRAMVRLGLAREQEQPEPDLVLQTLRQEHPALHRERRFQQRRKPQLKRRSKARKVSRDSK